MPFLFFQAEKRGQNEKQRKQIIDFFTHYGRIREKTNTKGEMEMAKFAFGKEGVKNIKFEEGDPEGLECSFTLFGGECSFYVDLQLQATEEYREILCVTPRNGIEYLDAVEVTNSTWQMLNGLARDALEKDKSLRLRYLKQIWEVKA